MVFWLFSIHRLFPTLVYELEYPRTPHFRPLYLFEKVFGTCGLILCMTMIVSEHITPVLSQLSTMTPAGAFSLSFSFFFLQWLFSIMLDYFYSSINIFIILVFCFVFSLSFFFFILNCRCCTLSYHSIHSTFDSIFLCGFRVYP